MNVEKKMREERDYLKFRINEKSKGEGQSIKDF